MAENSAAPADLAYRDRDKWNQILFENANKFHLHQDNLRWSLSAGFAAFFYGGILVIYNPLVATNDQFVHFLQLALTLMGTAYFFVLMMEGWYYNLALAYLISCEKRVVAKLDLLPLADFDRDEVPPFHPSFACVLFLASLINTFHLFEFALTEFGKVYAICASSIYAGALFFLAIFGKVPRRIDATLEKMDRRLKKHPS
jgi:hypothetical protein